MTNNLPSVDATPETTAMIDGAASAPVARAASTREINEHSIHPAGHSHSPNFELRTSNFELQSGPTGEVFAVPLDPDSQQRFGRLTQAARDDLTATFAALKKIHAAKNKNAEIRRQSSLAQGARGFTHGSLRRKYYTFLASGDWTVLVNKSLAGPNWWKLDEQIGLPPDFVQFWKTLCENNQRKCKPAHRELLRIWRTRHDTLGRHYKSIPGYGPCGSHSPAPATEAHCQDWPSPDPHTGIPRGWSYENLQRLYSPDAFELDAARHGLFAASKHRRKVFTTRAGLAVCQFVFFDDHEYNKKVIFTGKGQAQRRATRPLSLTALDLASACPFANLFKPTLIDDETARKQKLRQNEMLWFIADVLCGAGYNPDTGTVFCVEHGTAAISSELEQRIADLTGGKVTVERSGRFGQAAHAGLFEGAGIRGNPRFKAPLESLYNLIDNEMALLPGQTGKDRNHAPDEMVGREKYAEKLLRVLTPELLAKAQLPFFTWPEFVAIVTEIFRRISNRIDHDLEGWEKSGYYAKEWRITPSAPWMSMDEFHALPVPQQMSLTELFNTPHGSALVRSRKLSPQEVFNRGAKALHRLPLVHVPHLLGPALATVRAVRGGYITLEDQELDTDTLRFPAHPGGLTNGEKYLTYLMSSSASSASSAVNSPVLICCDSKNRYLATLTLQHTPCRMDTDAVRRQIAAAKKEEAARLAPMQQRHHQDIAAKRDMHQHNAALLSGKSATPEDHARAAEIQEHIDQANTADILETPETPETPETSNFELRTSNFPNDDLNDLLH